MHYLLLLVSSKIYCIITRHKLSFVVCTESLLCLFMPFILFYISVFGELYVNLRTKIKIKYCDFSRSIIS